MDLKKEKLLKKVYAKLLEAGFGNGTIEDMPEFVVKDVMGYGTALDEKILSINEFIELMQNQRNQVANFDDFRYTSNPVITRMSDGGNTALIVDEIDLVTVFEKKSNLMHLRMSTLLEFLDETWKIIHWHGSTAEHVSDGEDPWHVNEWKQKTEKLKKLVEEKTVDLKHKNRELEIESSLERVRAVAMGMRKPEDMLDVCQIISEQLEILEVNGIRNIQVAIIDKLKKTYLNYQYFTPYTKKVFEETEYENHPTSWEMVNELQKSANSFFEGSLNGKALEEFSEWREKYKQFPDPLLDKTSAVHYYFYSIGHGGLGLTTYRAINDQELDIFKRFHNVFKLAYGRFVDIEKAEAQAREAQIEAALERVRAQAMGMQQSEELAGVGEIIFSELKSLGFTDLRNSEIIINNDDLESILSYYFSDYGVTGRIELDYKSNPIVQKWAKDVKKANDAFAKVEISTKEIGDWRKYREEVGYQPDPKLNKAKSVFYYSYSTGLGALSISTFSAISDEQIRILERFRNVFTLAYRRYADVAHAEEQALEAQIELALERVRARTMAMQKSDELKEIIQLIHDQLIHLNFDLDAAGFTLDYFQNNDWNIWIANKYQSLPSQIYVPYTDHPQFNYYKAAKEKGVDFFANTLSFEEKNSIFTYMFDFMGDYSQEEKDELLSKPGLAISQAFLKNITLWIYNLEGTPYAEKDNNTLMRFAGVFEQTYVRFNDLKHAEAQAREAEIELALERVRARAMAMHKSEELADLSLELVKQVQTLGVETWFCAFNIYDDDPKGSLEWGSNGQGTFPKYRTPREGIFLRYYKAGQKGEKLLINEIDENKCADHYEYLCSLPGVGDQLLQMKDAGLSFPTSQIDHVAFFKYGYILFITFEPAANAHDIFKRFAKVFEQTYTRFLDLKKAEAQAKEAQIEAALEKVRSHTMGMHSSEELANVATVMFDQLRILGGDLFSCGIVLCDKDKNEVEQWHSLPEAGMLPPFYVPVDLDYIHQYRYDQWKAGVELFSIEIPEDKIARHFELMETIPSLKEFMKAVAEKGLKMPEWPGWEIDYGASFRYGYILVSALQPFENKQILPRFANVFEQTYTRFLDLQKAEAQAREAQIEAALEKVRSRSLAMHKSEEIQEVVSVVAEKLMDLDVILDAGGVIICTYFKDSKDVMQWIASPDFSYSGSYLVPYFDHPVFNDSWDFKNSGIEYSSKSYSYEEKKSFFEYAFEFTDFKNFPEDAKKWIFENKKYSLSFAWAKNSAILIPSHEGILPSESNKEILIRFAKVFEQAYIRFIDLKKSEAQAREAEVQLAMERVRARTMAMQKSDELPQAANLLFQQVQSLGMPAWSAGYCIWDDDKQAITLSMSSEGVIQPSLRMPLTEDPTLMHFLEAHQRGEQFFVEEVGGKVLKEHYVYLRSLAGVKESLDEIEKAGYPVPEYQINHCAYFSKGFLLFITYEPVPEAYDIFKRFAGVYEQTYTRFLDLQKAEAQAREAQIESALERVRSKTMAMHNSQDVGATVVTLFEEVLKLGIDKSSRIGIGILEGYDGMETRSANSLPDGKVDLKMGMLDMTIHPMLVGLKEAWKRGESGYSYDYIGEDVYTYYHALSQEPEYPFKIDLDALPENEYHSSFFFKEGILFFFAPNPISNEASNVLSRFAQVFGQTYRRYLDLQKAEAQARESQIEAALERVRARSMAMQRSEELAETASHLFKQFTELGIHTYRCNIAIMDSENDLIQLWSTTNSGQVIPISSQIPFAEYPVFGTMYEEWERKEKRSIIKLVGEDRLNWTNYIMKYVSFEEYTPGRIDMNKVTNEMAVFTNFFFSQGFFVIHTTDDISEPDMNIIQRFAKVFEQTFTRFQDLQKAEFQANEVIKQASLDRVRGQIASMRSTDDLQRITPLIWRELETLDVPFNRCGVFIIDEMISQVRVYLTTPNAKPLGVLELPFDANDLTRNTIEHWRRKAVYTIHWNKNDFINWVQSMVKQGQIQNTKQYQGNVAPPETLDLHFIPFGQGMLYVGNNEPLSEDKIDLVKSLARSFSVAYARYEDFKQLEDAKNKIEITLYDLKSTQTQLIQAEKMASLGELTAGIAHEIQNPLNFVNNFSEVNAELIEELKEEVDGGDLEEVIAIADDIASNEKKINHHGKRADAIVKGMLQHSRSTKGEKQLTDINELADEYLRLAYHGLRAKDNSFNASFKTELDEALPKIEVVAQDIGRVLLNLINNAFFAVDKKTKEDTGNFKPEVSITTKYIDSNVEITVRDNGSGIPSDIKDKIFQPFFTTKPTGQGTGLGLSLSYDIITKGHGGELKVKSKENKGSEFIIIIPIATSL